MALLHENLPLGVVGPVCVHLGPFFVGRRRAAEYPVVHRRRHVGKFFVLRGATDRDAARGSAGAGRHAVHPCFYDGAGVFAVSLGVDHGDVSDDDRCAPPSERARDGEDRVAERGRPGTGDFSRGRILYVHRQRAAGCGAPGEGSEGEEGRRGRRPWQDRLQFRVGPEDLRCERLGRAEGGAAVFHAGAAGGRQTPRRHRYGGSSARGAGEGGTRVGDGSGEGDAAAVLPA